MSQNWGFVSHLPQSDRIEVKWVGHWSPVFSILFSFEFGPFLWLHAVRFCLIVDSIVNNTGHHLSSLIHSTSRSQNQSSLSQAGIESHIIHSPLPHQKRGSPFHRNLKLLKKFLETEHDCNGIPCNPWWGEGMTTDQQNHKMQIQFDEWWIIASGVLLLLGLKATCSLSRERLLYSHGCYQYWR